MTYLRHMKIKNILDAMERWAPLAYQENYDNAGLITGNADVNYTGVLITLDCTENVVQEAIDLNCNLIVAHHPIIFKGLKKLTGSNYVERTIIKAIKNDIAIYASHTNLDSVSNGVNKKICDLIGLHQTRILSPKSNSLEKMTVFIPKDYVETVMGPVFEVGAGHIGDYEECSFNVGGQGQFKPNNHAKPYVGSSNEREYVEEIRVEFIYPKHLSRKIVGKLKSAHPYEEPAYFLNPLENMFEQVGSGMIGELSEEYDFMDFVNHLKKMMKLDQIKSTQKPTTPIKKVAVCGGSGSFLLKNAMASGADVFITSDFKYHEYFDADGEITILDIGHYESEVFTKDLIGDYLQNIFPNIALNFSKINTNPITFY